MSPKEYIDNLYAKIETAGNADKGAYSYSIIQLKNKYPEFTNYTQSIYQDIKRFIECYIVTKSKRDYGYDIIDLNKIIRSIYYSSKIEEQNALFLYTYRVLKNNQFEKDAECIIPEIRRTKLSCIWANSSWLSKIFKYLFYLVSYNLTAVIILLTILFVLFYTITFPFLEYKDTFLIISCTDYCTNKYCNHLINLIGYTFGGADNFISPANWKGVILLSSMKLFYILFIVNYLFKIILERLNLNK